MSNLLGKASILTTPTAYDNGKILSVKPNTSVGDFDFTRNSSATRVNSQGLVEDVQILSSNLVQNGDFSQEGSELITNGGFDTDSDWNLTNGATINDGSLNIDYNLGNGSTTQTNVFTIGKTYKVQVNVDYNSTGVARINSGLPPTTLTNGLNTFYLKAVGTSIEIRNHVNFIGSIDNVSVKEVGQDWTLGTGITIGENKAIFTSTASGQSVSQNAVASSLTNGALAKVSFEVLTRTEGSFGVYFSGTLVGTLASAGVFTAYFTKGTETSFYIRALGTTSGSITNISVIEITDDTNLPRIDYTDGVGSWLFEPQSTNEISYSEDFSNAYWSKLGSPTITPNYGTSPNGQNNSVRIQGNSSTIIYNNGGFSATDGRSMYVKATSGSGSIQLLSNFNNTDNVFSIDENWKRVEVNTSSSATSTFYAVDMRGASTDIYDIEIWGAQIESGLVTSYIPTSGSTVTRLQDAAFGAGSSDLINSTEGVIYWEGVYFGSSGNNVISVSESGSNNYVALFFLSGSTILSRYYNNGSIQSNISYGGLNTTDYFKIAFSWSQDNFSLWVNGVRRSLDTSGNIITPNVFNKINFGSVSNSQNFFGKTKCLAVFKEALTDEELTCLTTI